MNLKKIILFVLVFLVSAQISYATSNYVLPYPLSMPGSLLYRPRLFFETLSKYWYFGSFGQFKYSLKESDKYLVEAKTLFEYGQYLNASSSLKISDEYFTKTLPNLLKAGGEGKDVSEKRKLLKEAAQKHIEVLKKLSNDLPEKFEWRPEKGKPTLIFIKIDIERSILVRSRYL